MVKKCFNCCRWILCGEADMNKLNCVNFEYKKTKINYIEKNEEYKKDTIQVFKEEK